MPRRSARSPAGNEIDEARALARERVDRDGAAVGLDEPLDDREPQARAGPPSARPDPRPGRTARRSATARRAGSPALVDHADDHLRARLPRMDRHRPSARVAPRVLEQVRERPLELRRVGPDRREVRVDRDADVDLAPAARRARPAAPPRSRSIRAAVPPCPTEASTGRAACRSAPTAARASSTTAARELAALLVGVIDSALSACPAVRIAVMGVRRSCDDRLQQRVLSSSLRRSAFVSTASAWAASRCSAIAISASSAGTTLPVEPFGPRPMRGRAAPAASRSGGPIRPPAGTASRRSSPRSSPSSIAAERSSSRLGDPVGRGAQGGRGLGAREQLAREARREVRLTPAAVGFVGPAAREVGDRAHDRPRSA